MTDDLHPCVHCGGEALVVESVMDGQRIYQCVCTDCETPAQENTNMQRAIDFWQAWNTPEPKPRGRRKASNKTEVDQDPEPEIEPEPEEVEEEAP